LGVPQNLWVASRFSYSCMTDEVGVPLVAFGEVGVPLVAFGEVGWLKRNQVRVSLRSRSSVGLSALFQHFIAHLFPDLIPPLVGYA